LTAIKYLSKKLGYDEFVKSPTDQEIPMSSCCGVCGGQAPEQPKSQEKPENQDQSKEQTRAEAGKDRK
jgi:hypothetical protein